MPLISVIVPVYKVEKYIRKCVDSILAQTFTDFELFLVDDGSPDNCGKICDEYAKKDDRIIVIHKENGGLSEARNVAIDRATGDYLTFIDSDDYVTENHLKTLYSALLSTDSDIALSNITSFDEAGYNDLYKPTEEIKTLDGRDVFSTINRPNACAKLFKTRIYDTIRFPVGRLYEDVFVWHDVLAKAKRVVFTGVNSYFYYFRNNSIMHQEYRLQFTDIVDALELRIKKLEELRLNGLADENREFIYSRVGAAFAFLDAYVPENMKRLDEIKNIYDTEYPKLMKTTDNPKQKFRYWLLKISPKMHTKLFGKKMSKALG